MVADLAVDLDPRRNVKTDAVRSQTSLPKVLAAATCDAASRWWSGRVQRRPPHAVDMVLMGMTTLPR